MGKTALGLLAAVGVACGVAMWVVPKPGAAAGAGQPPEGQPKKDPNPDPKAQPKGEPKAEPRADGPAQKWEYCQLYLDAIETQKPPPEKLSSETRVMLFLPDKTHQADSFTALCRLIGHEAKANTATETLNALGQHGWELVGVTATRQVGGQVTVIERSWAFKRPARK